MDGWIHDARNSFLKVWTVACCVASTLLATNSKRLIYIYLSCLIAVGLTSLFHVITFQMFSLGDPSGLQVDHFTTLLIDDSICCSKNCMYYLQLMVHHTLTVSTDANFHSLSISTLLNVFPFKNSFWLICLLFTFYKMSSFFQKQSCSYWNNLLMRQIVSKMEEKGFITFIHFAQ